MKTIKLNQMAKKSVQVEEKDLELLKELNGKISLLLSQIGGYEAEKMILLNQLGQLQAESEENKKYLQKRYGDGSIDLSTGKFTKHEPNKED